MRLHEIFRRFARHVAAAVGSPVSFVLALLVIVLWAATGPMFGYSDTWQLVINTGTTIVTFLVVFAIQNTQNRDSKAIHLKLDELIKSLRHARNTMIDVEDMTDEQLAQLEHEFRDAGKRVVEQREHRRRHHHTHHQA